MPVHVGTTDPWVHAAPEVLVSQQSHSPGDMAASAGPSPHTARCVLGVTLCFCVFFGACKNVLVLWGFFFFFLSSELTIGNLLTRETNTDA